MKKLSTALFCVIYCLSIIGGMFAVAPVAVAETSAAPERVGEVLTLREKNSDTYLLADGSYECVVYSQDKYYENEYGRLEEIDNTVVAAEYSAKGESYAYANKAGGVNYRFSDNKAAVSIDTGKEAIAFSVSSGRGTTAKAGGDDKTVIDDYKLSGENYISYAGVAGGTDLVYAVKTGYLKEYIILKDSSASGELTFTFDTEGLTAKPGDFGRVIFADESGEPVFELESLFAVDSAGAYTEDLEYVIGETRDGETDITVRVSQEYLNDADRVFPVLVDPSVVVYGPTTTYDTFVSESNPNSNYYLNDWLRTGKDSAFGVTRTYLKFDLPSSVPVDSITSAFICLYKCYGATPNIRAYRNTGSWTSSGLKWSNKPTFSATDYTGYATLYYTNEYRLNVKEIVKKWISGAYTNYGVMIKDNTESNTSQNTRFSSSDSDCEDIPELHIIYNNLVSVDRMYSVYSQTATYRDELQYNMNCYGYAMHIYCVDSYYFQQPGEFCRFENDPDDAYFIFSQNSYNALHGTGATLASASQYINSAFRSDLSVLDAQYGLEWDYETTSLGDTVPNGYRKIALAIRFDPNDMDNNDYHFFLRHSDGTWSHKQGNTPVKNTLNSGAVINDSNFSTALSETGYDDNVTYYLIKKPAIMDYYHTEGIGNGLQRTTPTFFSLDKAGDTISKCATLPFNTYTYTKNVRIDYIDDYDYFSFTPTVSDNYHFSVSHSGNDCFWLKVYNSYGVQIASQTGMSHPELDVYLSNNTTYYIMVKNDEDYASAVMNYQLIYVRDY